MPEKSNIEIKLVDQQEVPAPITKATGTGSSAGWTHLSITLPNMATEPGISPLVQEDIPSGQSR